MAVSEGGQKSLGSGSCLALARAMALMVARNKEKYLFMRFLTRVRLPTITKRRKNYSLLTTAIASFQPEAYKNNRFTQKLWLFG